MIPPRKAHHYIYQFCEGNAEKQKPTAGDTRCTLSLHNCRKQELSPHPFTSHNLLQHDLGIREALSICPEQEVDGAMRQSLGGVQFPPCGLN